MKTYLDCIPCFFKQALEAARLAGADEAQTKDILDRVARYIPGFPMTSTPPEMARYVYRAVQEVTGNSDPYRKIKSKSNSMALELYPRMKEMVASSKNPLFTAVELAIAGNIIDYGAKSSLVVEDEINKLFKLDFEFSASGKNRVFAFEDFQNTLSHADKILYLADNAGETVFDRILIEEMKNFLGKQPASIEMAYVVKEGPVINDAVLEDAVMSGIDKVIPVISSGCDAAGTVLSLCSPEFLDRFKSTDLIVSKGQGNFETLADESAPIFFLFKVKCQVIANHIGCNLGDAVLYHKESRNGQTATKTL